MKLNPLNRIGLFVRSIPALQTGKRWIQRLLSKNYILITGCQRSGTTLMLLILDAHSKVRGLGETEADYFNHPGVRTLLRDTTSGHVTCRKMPVASGDLTRLSARYPDVNIIWMVRNPLAVVSSMRKLKLDGWDYNWLGLYAEHELNNLSRLFPDAKEGLSKLSPIEVGARIWSLNCEAIEKYADAGFNINVVRYEDLLQNPLSTTKSLFPKLPLEWEPAVLAFPEKEKNQSRVLAGDTKGSSELDPSRAKPDLDLTSKECNRVIRLSTI